MGPFASCRFRRETTISAPQRPRVSTIVVDDEPVARSGLRSILSSYEWITVVGEASNGLSAVDLIDRLEPELAFLDIEMPGLPGIEILNKVKHQPFVVFTTAYAQYAATAFELGALDYVLKPFGAERIAKALDRVRSVLGEPAPPASERLQEALSSGPMSRLFVRTGNGVVPVLVSDIIRFEAAGDYVTAFTARTRHMIHVSLNRLEARLDSQRFARVHRAHIVNLDQVSAFKRQARGFTAEMADGARVPVSREKARDIKELGL